jgi:hypothetical protein
MWTADQRAVAPPPCASPRGRDRDRWSNGRPSRASHDLGEDQEVLGRAGADEPESRREPVRFIRKCGFCTGAQWRTPDPLHARIMASSRPDRAEGGVICSDSPLVWGSLGDNIAGQLNTRLDNLSPPDSGPLPPGRGGHRRRDRRPEQRRSRCPPARPRRLQPRRGPRPAGAVGAEPLRGRQRGRSREEGGCGAFGPRNSASA